MNKKTRILIIGGACLGIIFAFIYALFPAVKIGVPIECKIGQMLLVGFQGTHIDNLRLKSYIEKEDIGGLLIFPRNIVSREQFSSLIKDIKNINTKYPLIIAVDEEGGSKGRLNSSKGFEDFPSSKDIAANMTPEEAHNLYGNVAKMLRKAGINLNLMPVVELDINPENGVIGKAGRSFSKDPLVVTEYAGQLVRAFREEGLLTTLKHYPGYTSISVDPHFEIADITSTFQSGQLLPYKKLIRQGLAESIMVAHVMDKNVDPHLPASLSYSHVTENLRKKMGFNGVAITDDLQMASVNSLFTVEEAVIQAINAGCDMMLIGDYSYKDLRRIEHIKRAVIKAVANGRIDRRRIDESFKRIMKFKKSIGSKKWI